MQPLMIRAIVPRQSTAHASDFDQMHIAAITQPLQRPPAAGAQQQRFAADNTAALAAARESAEKGAVRQRIKKGGLRLFAMWQFSTLCSCGDEGHNECHIGRCFCHITPRAAVPFEKVIHAAARATLYGGRNSRQADTGALAPTASGK